MSGLARWWKSIWAQIKAQRTPQPPVPQPAPEPQPAPDKPVAGNSDVPSGVVRAVNGGGGPHPFDPFAAMATRKMRSARWIPGDLIRMEYDSISAWPRRGMGGWDSWGGVCAYRREGDALVGGWFDHIAREGQVVKDTANWRNGYMRSPPPRNGEVWLCLISSDGKQRTNLVRIE